jgi:hypothetical protein
LSFWPDIIKVSIILRSFMALASSKPLTIEGMGLSLELQWRSERIWTASAFLSLIARTRGLLPQGSISFLSVKIIPSCLQAIRREMRWRLPSKTA